MLQTPPNFVPLLTAPSSTSSASALNFVFRGDELLVSAEDLSLPDGYALAMMDIANAQCQPVGSLDQRYCQTTWQTRDTLACDGYVWRKLRTLFGMFNAELMAVAGRAFQIAEWARTHRFCGNCGTATTHTPGERCMGCPACGMVAYPRISPAMMVLIKREDSILLARHAASPTQFFTALAGFLEAGESAEDAVHREVFEEVGLKVKNIQYFGSQPWPFPHSLMIAFTAEYVSGDITVDETEIAEARWFGPQDTVPKIPYGVSIASDLIYAHLPSGAN